MCVGYTFSGCSAAEALLCPQMRIGRLHTYMPGWADANYAFIRSGGFRLSQRVADVQQPTLVVFGAQDRILPPSDAQRFADAIPHAQVPGLCHVNEACWHALAPGRLPAAARRRCMTAAVSCTLPVILPHLH